MSCFLSLYSFSGEDQDATAKKLALMFKIAPQQASAIIDQVSKGEAWRTPGEVSDQQAAVVEQYLKGIGFQVERSGQQETVDQIAGSIKLERKSSADLPPDKAAGSPGSGVTTAEGPPGQAPPTGSAVRPPGNGGTTDSGGPPQGMPIEFHGTGGGLFKIMFVNLILTLLTLGIYSFWGKTKVRRYLCEQSSFAGDRFYYHGTGWELFRGALIFGAMFGLFNLGLYSIGQVWGMEAQIVAQTVGPLLIIFLFPIILVGAFKYRLSRTAWRGIRFSFRGKRKSALWLYIKGYLFTLLTLGFYTPYFTINAQKFWIGESYFGNQSFQYDGKGKDIFQAFLVLVLMYVLTIGAPLLLNLYVPGIGEEQLAQMMMIMYIPLGVAFMWYTVYLARYHWSKTEFAGGTFNYDATTYQWISLNITNLFLIIVTLGFAIPLAEIRSRRFFADHLAVAGNMQLSQVVQEAQKSSALGEGIADGFDIDVDIGI